MKKIFSCISISLVCLSYSCNKGEFLSQVFKPGHYTSPTLEDLEKVLENEILFSPSHGLTLISADQFYFTDQFVATMSASQRNTYTWAYEISDEKDIPEDWSQPYAQVQYANEILSVLADISKNATLTSRHFHVEGRARFVRSNAFFNLSQNFAPPYTSETARTDLGIPIRLTPGIGEIATRFTVQQTYDCIISDLKRAAQVLPVQYDSLNIGRPSRPATFALLARVYLAMRQYDKAGLYADSSLQLRNTLIDYNTIDDTCQFPFTATNKEILYVNRPFSSSSMSMAIVTGACFIDSALYRSYAPGDLRRKIFFSETTGGRVLPKGSYLGSKDRFTGLAVDEVYLIRAECLARAGLTAQAMDKLNELLKNRYHKDWFVPLTATDHNKALELILNERNKQLVLRGQRWTDLRRLNMENASITLTRVVNGQRFELAPNHNRYVLPIPRKVISLTGMPQNPG